MKTIGSGAAGLARAATIATASRIVRPAGFERFSGTTKNPQRACRSAAIGSGVFGQGALWKRDCAFTLWLAAKNATRARTDMAAIRIAVTIAYP
jgi:hypothetical protein